MKKILLIIIILFFTKLSAKSSNFLYATEYESSIIFPSGYVIGDYIEFLKVNPISANSSGYYQISINYTRGNLASAATHIASLSHANPSLWRETGRINNNPYTGTGVNFTVDCNTQAGNARFRIRAIGTLGISAPIVVYIKVTSLNSNDAFTALNTIGNDTTVSKFLPMTSDWNLYVGNVFATDGASLAIKAIQNGNVGIGTPNPDEKLTVKGKIHTQEVRVDMAGPLVPDYVFENDYKLKSLQEIENYIKENKHLPEIPSALEIEKNGLMLAEMNMTLLKKIEEMTLYMIEMKKENEALKNNQIVLEKRIQKLENK